MESIIEGFGIDRYSRAILSNVVLPFAVGRKDDLFWVERIFKLTNPDGEISGGETVSVDGNGIELVRIRVEFHSRSTRKRLVGLQSHGGGFEVLVSINRSEIVEGVTCIDG